MNKTQQLQGKQHEVEVVIQNSSENQSNLTAPSPSKLGSYPRNILNPDQVVVQRLSIPDSITMSDGRGGPARSHMNKTLQTRLSYGTQEDL